MNSWSPTPAVKLEPFEMERWQSTHENEVSFNLSESGVEPLSLGDLLSEEDVARLLDARLGYPETRGSVALREAIASLYPDAGPENILTTNGTSEANLTTALWSMEMDARFVAILPNYMQMWGLARSLQCRVMELFLEEKLGWQPSMEKMEQAMAFGPRAVSLSNPNNPTGSRLDSGSRRALLEAAEDAGAWLLCDEVYRGAEKDGLLTPSLWGEYEKVLVTSGLSKTFGLPGLRLGWICGPLEVIEDLWAVHDYTSIAISKVTELLGALAVSRWGEARDRARRIINGNLPLLESFVRQAGLSWKPPEAGAVAFVRYPWKLPSREIADRALKRDVLIVPGSHFGMEGYLRIGYGMERRILKGGLERLGGVLEDLGER